MLQSLPSSRPLMAIALLGAALLWLAPGSSAQTAPAYPSNGGMAEKLQPFIDKQTIAGAVVLVADKDKVLDLETIGYADLSTKKPMEANDLFYIASMTKMFTSVALMMLVDEGKVKLDDPVEKYLPEFKGQMVKEGDGPAHPPRHPITIKEVMSHTAGLPGNSSPSKLNSHNLEAYVKLLAKTPLFCEPGTQMLYSPGPAVGGRIVEVLSGIPYCEFIQKKICEPLGLKDTTFFPTEEQAARLARSHRFDEKTKKLEPLDHLEALGKLGKDSGVPLPILRGFGAQALENTKNHFANPAGSLFSTALDCGRFCQMLLNNGSWQGKKYLTPEAVHLMSTDYAGELGKGEVGYGIGCFVQHKAISGGTSVGSYGHHGAAKTQMWIDPKNGIVMVLMIQCANLKGPDEKAIYTAYRQQAIARFGKAR